MVAPSRELVLSQQYNGAAVIKWIFKNPTKRLTCCAVSDFWRNEADSLSKILETSPDSLPFAQASPSLPVKSQSIRSKSLSYKFQV